MVSNPTTRRGIRALQTRAHVLDTARVVFTEVGFEAATIRVIARRAKLSTGALFAHWTGKEALYREATGRAPPTQELVDMLVSALSTCRDVIENAGVYFPPGSMGRADAELGIEVAERAIAQAQGARP